MKEVKNQKDTTTLCKNSFESGNNFYFTNVQVLTQENSFQIKSINEIIHLKETPNAINYKTHIDKMRPIYNELLT